LLDQTYSISSVSTGCLPEIANIVARLSLSKLVIQNCSRPFEGQSKPALTPQAEKGNKRRVQFLKYIPCHITSREVRTRGEWGERKRGHKEAIYGDYRRDNEAKATM